MDLVDLYLWGWVVTTIIAILAARKFRDDASPPELQSIAAVSLLAGALWPVLLLGVVELGSLQTVSRLRADS